MSSFIVKIETNDFIHSAQIDIACFDFYFHYREGERRKYLDVNSIKHIMQNNDHRYQGT